MLIFVPKMPIGPIFGTRRITLKIEASPETLFIAYNHLQFRNILINRFRFNLKNADIVHKNTPFPKFWAWQNFLKNPKLPGLSAFWWLSSGTILEKSNE